MKRFKKTCAAAIIALAAFTGLPARALAAGPGELLTPVGRAVAIELRTEGVIVADLAAVQTEQGEVRPAADAGMQAGDQIIGVNGAVIGGSDDFLTAVQALDGSPVAIDAERDGKTLHFAVTPVRGVTGSWYLGLWLRDTIAGIGTITFQDPASGLFGALGHGVGTAANGALTPVSGGSIASAAVREVVAGARGTPGELVGVPDGTGPLGGVFGNTCAGIFGYAAPLSGGRPLPVAGEEEIALGPATILATVDESGAREFGVEITRIARGGDDTRQLSLTVTDAALLAVTGGIVQGMSGSPILQNGKLVGAVTHVLVEDPTKGYGVTIARMLRECAGAEQAAA